MEKERNEFPVQLSQLPLISECTFLQLLFFHFLAFDLCSWRRRNRETKCNGMSVEWWNVGNAIQWDYASWMCGSGICSFILLFLGSPFSPLQLMIPFEIGEHSRRSYVEEWHGARPLFIARSFNSRSCEKRVDWQFGSAVEDAKWGWNSWSSKGEDGEEERSIFAAVHLFTSFCKFSSIFPMTRRFIGNAVQWRREEDKMRQF